MWYTGLGRTGYRDKKTMMETVQMPQQIQAKWRDINGWNYYFFLKLALLWGGHLNFHPLANLVFLAFLLIPIPSIILHRCRNWIAVPIGLALFYHDTWLPGWSAISSQGTNLFQFSASYLLELLNNFINWQMIGMAFVLLVGYLFLSQWIRMTTLTVVLLIWLNILSLASPSVNFWPERTQNAANTDSVSGANHGTDLNTRLPPTNENLNRYLNEFYEQQKELHTKFPPALSANALPFDIIIIQICSLAWSDIDAAHLRNHPLWSKFDLMFNHFNSAASYS
jgi:cellulose synthase operon protein YhjU